MTRPPLPAFLLATLLTALVSGLGAPAGASAATSSQSAAEDERLGPPRGFPVEGEALETMTEELTSVMRCPVCQGLSVADSPTDSALAMKDRVRDLLAAGYTPTQVLEYFEASYGEFIRLEPKPVGFNLLVWIVPALALVAGGLLVALRMRRRTGGEESSAPSDAELEAYREKIRREVSP